MSMPPIQPLGAIGALDPTLAKASATAVQPPRGASFAQLLMGGIDQVNQTLTEADAKVAAFAVDYIMPPHEVLFAVEQARHSLELMLQIRSRLVEGYQELMRMQL